MKVLILSLFFVTAIPTAGFCQTQYTYLAQILRTSDGVSQLAGPQKISGSPADSCIDNNICVVLGAKTVGGVQEKRFLVCRLKDGLCPTHPADCSTESITGSNLVLKLDKFELDYRSRKCVSDSKNLDSCKKDCSKVACGNESSQSYEAKCEGPSKKYCDLKFNSTVLTSKPTDDPEYSKDKLPTQNCFSFFSKSRCGSSYTESPSEACKFQAAKHCADLGKKRASDGLLICAQGPDPAPCRDKCIASFTSFLNGGTETGEAKETQVTAVQSQLLPVPYNPADINAANSENFKAEVAQFTEQFCSQIPTPIATARR